jgi:hypothetical protein
MPVSDGLAAARAADHQPAPGDMTRGQSSFQSETEWRRCDR